MNKKQKSTYCAVVIAMLTFASAPATESHDVAPSGTVPEGNHKADRVQKELSVLQELHELASQSKDQAVSPASPLAMRIKQTLSKLSTVDELRQMALLCHGVTYPQMAEDIAYDLVFDHAMWLCIQRIADTPGGDAAAALRSLKPVIGPDAHPSEIMTEMMEKQQKIKK